MTEAREPSPQSAALGDGGLSDREIGQAAPQTGAWLEFLGRVLLHPAPVGQAG